MFDVCWNPFDLDRSKLQDYRDGKINAENVLYDVLDSYDTLEEAIKNGSGSVWYEYRNNPKKVLIHEIRILDENGNTVYVFELDDYAENYVEDEFGEE